MKSTSFCKYCSSYHWNKSQFHFTNEWVSSAQRLGDSSSRHRRSGISNTEELWSLSLFLHTFFMTLRALADFVEMKISHDIKVSISLSLLTDFMPNLIASPTFRLFPETSSLPSHNLLSPSSRLKPRVFCLKIKQDSQQQRVQTIENWARTECGEMEGNRRQKLGRKSSTREIQKNEKEKSSMKISPDVDECCFSTEFVSLFSSLFRSKIAPLLNFPPS